MPNLFWLAVWHWRRWRLRVEWNALCDIYERADCGAALSEYIRPDLVNRRAAFDARMEALKKIEQEHL